MRILRLLDRSVAAAVMVLLVLSFSLMLALAAGQVLLRQLIHTNLPWGDLAARQLVIWVGFLGAALASRRGQHFHIGFLQRLLPPSLRPWLRATTDLLAAGACAVLVRAGWTFVTVGLDPRATLFLGIRQSAAAAVVPAGFGLMAVQFLLRAANEAARAARGAADRGPR